VHLVGHVAGDARVSAVADDIGEDIRLRRRGLSSFSKGGVDPMAARLSARRAEVCSIMTVASSAALGDRSEKRCEGVDKSRTGGGSARGTTSSTRLGLNWTGQDSKSLL